MPNIPAFITLDDQETRSIDWLEREVARLSENGVVHGIDLSRVKGKVNTFVFPRGFEPGRGYVLMERSAALELDLNTADHKLRFQAGGNIIFQKLLIVAVEEITGTDEPQTRSLCMVELADLRVLGPLTSINKSYNVSTYDESDYYESTKKDTTDDWTYETIIQDIWDEMPADFGDLGVTDADFPSGKPENYVFQGVSAWDALRKIVEDINHTLVLTRSGSFGVVACATSPGNYESDRDDNKPYILCGSHDLNPTAASIPEKVKVFFPKRDKAWQTNTDPLVLTFKDHWQLSPLFEVEVNTADIDAELVVITGTIYPIHDSLQALYDEEGTIQNETDLEDRADVVAEAYLKSLNVADQPSNYRYSGARSFSPDADLACVAYYDLGFGVITETRGIDRTQIPSPILDQNLLSSGLINLTGENRSPPHLTQFHLDTERFLVARLDESLDAGQSTTGKVQFGVGDPIVWAAATPEREIAIYNIFETSFQADTLVVCWFYQQTEKWIVLGVGSVEFVKITGGTNTGDLVEAVSGVHTAVVVRWDTAGAELLGEEECLVRFIDWDVIDDGGTIAEHDRIHMAKLVGVQDDKPLYLATLGEQTYVSKPTADIEKGASGSAELYNGDETPSGIFKTAKALGIKVWAGKWTTTQRMRGGSWYHGCWEA